MKLSTARILPFVYFSVIPFARANVHHHRQAVSSGSSSSRVSSSVPVASAASSAASSLGSSTSLSGTLLPTPTGPTPSITLASQNPTAVPLASIVVNAPSAPTLTMPSAYPAGTKPSSIPNAPGLPDLSTFSPSKYPALDRPPPTDSPEVQQWIQEVAQSGVTIPSFTATVSGGCPANPAAAADPSRCWWTCGGCTTSTDITTCPQKYQWGLTYDDGPAPYTPNLLDYLNQVNLKATFFVVGSRVASWPSLLQQEYLSGHQIAVHTWSHYALTTLTNEQIIAEFGWSKKIIRDVLGVQPIFMRPPFGDIDNRVRAIAKAMNLIPIIWTRISPTATFDTDDFDIHGGLTNVQQVLFNWENIIGNATTMNNGFIVLEHDLFQQSVEVATGYILPDALARQPAFNITPVISCLNHPLSDAYIETNDNSSNPLPVTSNGTSSNSTGTGSGSSKTNGAIVGTVPGMDALAIVTMAAILGAMVATI